MERKRRELKASSQHPPLLLYVSLKIHLILQLFLPRSSSLDQEQEYNTMLPPPPSPLSKGGTPPFFRPNDPSIPLPPPFPRVSFLFPSLLSSASSSKETNNGHSAEGGRGRRKKTKKTPLALFFPRKGRRAYRVENKSLSLKSEITEFFHFNLGNFPGNFHETIDC